jgi:hypothetical protein
MEPEGSIPSSQEPSTGPYPEPYQSNPLHPILSLQDPLSTVYNPLNNDSNPYIDHYLALPFTNQHPLTLTTPKGILGEITLLNPRKAPGADLITAKMLEELPRKDLVLLPYIYNAILCIGYWPKPFKIANIIMIGKPGKDLTDVQNYFPISLLPIMTKLLDILYYANSTRTSYLENGFRIINSDFVQLTLQYSSVIDSQEK